MARKRVSYQNLLKDAISEFDTSKTVDIKGPMLDPILKWDGQGEIPVYKDAASILERYYFNESSDKGVEIDEMEYNEDGTEAKTDSEQYSEGEGTEQAGTSDEKDISNTKKKVASTIAKEQKNMDTKNEEENKKEESEEEKETDQITEDLENLVIEKLIAEMEEDEENEEIEEQDSTKGEGTEQAGTGDAEKELPDRKDRSDEIPAKIKEQDENNEEEDELDIDQKINKENALPGGPKKAKAEDQNDEDLYEEAFKLFEEAIVENEE